MADAAEVFAGITRRRGHALRRARAEPEGPRARARRRRRRGRHLRGRVGDVQPPQHQPVDRRVARDLRARWRARRSPPACACAAYLSTAFGCPFEGDGAGRRASIDLTRRLLDLGVYEVAVSDTIGIAHPGQVRAGARRDLTRRVPAARRSRCTSTTRAAPRSPTCWPRSTSASRRSTRRPAASAAARTRPAPPATSRPRICSTCCTASATRRASTSTRSAPRRLALEPALGHALPSRYVRARQAADDVAARMPDADVDRFIAALRSATRRRCARPEFLKAIRALSARYVERRAELCRSIAARFGRQARGVRGLLRAAALPHHDARFCAPSAPIGILSIASSILAAARAWRARRGRARWASARRSRASTRAAGRWTRRTGRIERSVSAGARRAAIWSARPRRSGRALRRASR